MLRLGGRVGLILIRRIFWDNGLKTVAAVANADPKELLPVLMQAQPNKVKLGAKDEQKFKDKLLAKAKIIADSANRLWRKRDPYGVCLLVRTGLIRTDGTRCRGRDAVGDGGRITGRRLPISSTRALLGALDPLGDEKTLSPGVALQEHRGSTGVTLWIGDVWTLGALLFVCNVCGYCVAWQTCGSDLWPGGVEQVTKPTNPRGGKQ